LYSKYLSINPRSRFVYLSYM